MGNFSKKNIIILLILIVIALLSIFAVANYVTGEGFIDPIKKSLDEKQGTVLKLAAGAALISTAISAIPGDAAMPIATQIAELTSWFIIILCAILLEKMLVGVVGYVSFLIIIPFSCFLGALSIFVKKEIIRNLAIKLAIFGIVLFIAIPASVLLSEMIYSTSQERVAQIAEDVNPETTVTSETAEQNETAEQTGINETNEIADENIETSDEKQSIWNKVGGLITNAPSNIKSSAVDILGNAKETVENVKDSTSNLINNMYELPKIAEDVLNNFIESIAILIVTSCVIPIVVILIFMWMIKILFGFDVMAVAQRKKENFTFNKVAELNKPTEITDTNEVNNSEN